MMLRREFDTSILLLSVVLTCLGVVMVYSASSIMAGKKFADGFYFLKRQGIFAVAGLMIMAFAMQIDYRHYRKVAALGLLISIVLLVLVLIPGVGKHIGGAARWIRLPGLSLQPSEVVKFALVVYLAHSISKKGERIREFAYGFLPYLLIMVLLVGLLLLQPDLGGALTLSAVLLVMVSIAGARLRYLFMLAALAMPALYFLVMNVDYRRKRILAFLNPWEDPSNTGFQIIQSWIAFGSGGLAGNGLGESKQKLFYLPEAHTDFIFSVLGEELGFIGVFVVTAMFLLLIARGMKTALACPDHFGRYLAFGISLLLGMEAFVNIAVVMGMLPTKGLALPFLSYGGTSLLTTLFAVGVLLNISSQVPEVSR
jgi:cell division protein FtsW